MKPTPIKNNHSRGFTLIITISLMALLVVVGIGFLNLSAVTLRGSSKIEARAIAQSNARLALMMAIGELQKNTGQDTRITAPSTIVDANLPPLTGVWRSWEGSDHEANGRPRAPQYTTKDQSEATGGRFIDWLVSSAAAIVAPELSDATTLVRTTSNANTIPLLADGSLLATDTRQVHVVPSQLKDNGRFAWWVSGENQKALLAQPYNPRTNDVAGLAEMGQSHTIANPETFGLSTLLTDHESYNPNATAAKPASKSVSRQTMALIEENNAIKPQKKFHDLSSYSVGLLTNSATGGWRKDLSLLTEQWDAIYASTPGGRLPLFRYTPTAGAAASSQVPKPTVASYEPLQSNFYPWSEYSLILGFKTPSTYHAASASWASLVNFATSYKNFTYNTGTVTSPFVWDVIATQRSANIVPQHFFNYKHKQRLHPQVARFQFLVYARAVETIPVQTPKRYQMRFLYTPIFTLWNPYNVSLEHDINSSIASSNALTSKFLGLGWRRAPAGVMAVVNKASAPWFNNPALVPNNQYQLFTPGNFQTLDRPGNNVNPYDTGLASNVAKGYNQRRVDKRTYGCWLPNGKLTFKPGEAKMFSPGFIDNVYPWSSVMRLTEGFNSANILGTEFAGATNLLASQSFWFLMKTDKVTQPYLDRQPGIGFSLSFGNEGPAGSVHYGGGTMPTAIGQNEFHNLTMLSSEAQGNAYWPPTQVDEVGYSVGELASGPWIPLFSISMGPRTTIGTGPGTEQTRPTKGVLQSNPLAAMSLSDPASGSAKDHPANGTFDITYHSLTLGSNITPNVSTSKGFIATGYQSGDGLSRLVMCDIPLRPMASLGELQGWNPRGHNPYPPFQHNLIGNSDATPLIPNNQVVPSVLTPGTVATNLQHDDAYCANHLLFDDWFVSSIAPRPYSFGNSIEKDISTLYRDYLSGDEILTNRVYKRIQADTNLSPTQISALATKIINTNPETSRNDGWLKVASRFEVEGMFNVNTTSVDAWKALLGRAKSIEQIAMHGATEMVATNAPNNHAVTRGPIASDVEAGTGAGFGGQFANASEYAGFRSLTDAQIEDLAEKVVDQVRLRGPFLSLSEFVNRQLSTNTNLALAGALQSALNNLTQDPMAVLRNPANSLSDNTMPASDSKLSGVNYQFPESAVGSSAYGAPGWIRQADILRPIAPILSVRDDTFTIRTYGDALDQNGNVIAKAWCEGVVKRTREFSNSADAADSIDPPVNAFNTTYGRRYEIVSFRWLTPDEV